MKPVTVTFDADEWQAVPRKATAEMLEAGERASDAEDATYETVFDAMLAAAPSPPALRVGSELYKHRHAEPIGNCCYGGQKPKSACGSCGAWKQGGDPVAYLHYARKKPELRELSFRPDLPAIHAGWLTRPLVFGDTQPPAVSAEPVAHMWFDDGGNCHVVAGPPTDAGCDPLYLAPPSADAKDAALPIDHDAEMDRYYIPVHPDWEIQTKGKGSSFRIANRKTGGRWLVMDKCLHKTLEQMARDINAAMQKGGA